MWNVGLCKAGVDALVGGDVRHEVVDDDGDRVFATKAIVERLRGGGSGSVRDGRGSSSRVGSLLLIAARCEYQGKRKDLKRGVALHIYLLWR